MTDLLTTPELVRETVKEPAKRWRNWYRALAGFLDPGGFVEEGEVYHGTRLWPSKDAAETRALEEASDLRFATANGDAQYLGAYPEGERP